MMGKILATLLCASMALGMMGCGSGNGGGSTQKGSSSDETVTLLSWYTEAQMSDVKAGFEKENPGYELEVQYVPPTEQYVQKLTLIMNEYEPTF